MQSSMAQGKDTSATLNYFLDPSKGGSASYCLGTVGEKRRKHAPVHVKIVDIRGSKEEVKIDTHGFQLVEHESPEKLFEEDERITSIYYPDCEELIKSITGATKVVPFSHIVRRQSWQTAFDAEKDLDDSARSKGPSTANFVHCDQSYDGARMRILETYPEAEIDSHRWGIINVWRPIGRPVTRNALAMCDARSIPEKDLFEATASFPETAMADEDKENTVPKGGNDPYPKRKPFGVWELRPPTTPGEHKWYYASEMKPNEAILLKIFDSKKTGVARRSPHTAFVSPEDHGPARQSLEVRCFVHWEDQTSE